MSSHTAIVMPSQFDISDRFARTGVLTRILSSMGWTLGLVIISPLFPIIALMHLLSWLERRQSV